MMTLLTVLFVAAMIFKVAGILVGTYLLFRAFGWVHQSSPRLAWVLVAGIVFTVSIAALGVNYLKRAKVEARAQASAATLQQRREVANERRWEQARATEAERKSHAELVDRWHAARRTAIRQWRQDLVDAKAVGGLGVTPPMLSIDDNGSLVTITNRATQPACVLVTRIATRNSGVLSRCTVGGIRCTVIRAGESARLPTLRAGNPESCLGGSLEFRVGNVDHLQPGWWSETALAAFGGDDPDPAFVDRWSDAVLTTDIVRLEKQIEDRTRVER